MLDLTEESPLPAAPTALYVHVPYCETKCGYCDFYSVPVSGRETAPLVAALGRELEVRLRGGPPPIRTVFFGGGTPTILPAEQLGGLLDAVTRWAPVDRLDEFTVEANPATVDAEKARLLREWGVTRVSMGAQSFFEAELAALERLHTPTDIAPSVAILRRHAIRQVNLDLIFGIPGQTLATWSQSLHRAIELAPDHVACYGLTYEPNTRLTAQRRAGRVTPCDEELEAEMYLCAMDTLAGAGFEQYEISNFARAGCESQHNLMYWRNEPYIGVGPSAAGCVHGRRYRNVAEIGAYIRMIGDRGEAEASSEILDNDMLILEMVMMQLRLNEGLSVAAFRRRTGHDPHVLFAPALASLAAGRLLRADDDRMALTRAGRLVADAVIRELTACLAEPQRDVALPVL